MTFIGHNNKYHIYISVGGSAIYKLYCCKYKKKKIIFKQYIYNYNIKLLLLCVTAINVIFILQKLLHLTKKILILKVSIIMLIMFKLFFLNKVVNHNI